MEFIEQRSHELRIRINLTGNETFAHHKRFSKGQTIEVDQVRVSVEVFDDGEAEPYISVKVYGRNILKDDSLGAPNADTVASLDNLPEKLQRNIAAHIAHFKAEVGVAP